MSNLPAKDAGGPDKLSDPFLDPFSLKRNFGRRWKVVMEESWGSETAENKKRQEGWYEIVPTACGGFIGLFQHHPTVILQFFTPKIRPTCRKLFEQFKDIPGVSLDVRFDGHETMLLFPASLFLEVAQAVGARKRRVLSSEHRAKLAEAGKATRFNPGLHGSKGRQNPQKEAIPLRAGGFPG